MTNDEFMDYWWNKGHERTVFVKELYLGVPELALIVSFPPDRVAAAQLSLLADKPF